MTAQWLYLLICSVSLFTCNSYKSNTTNGTSYFNLNRYQFTLSDIINETKKHLFMEDQNQSITIYNSHTLYFLIDDYSKIDFFDNNAFDEVYLCYKMNKSSLSSHKYRRRMTIDEEQETYALLMQNVQYLDDDERELFSQLWSEMNDEQRDVFMQEMGFWKNAKKKASKAWDKTKDVATNTFNDATQFGSNAWDKTKEFSGNAWDQTKQFGGNALDKTKEFGSNAWDKSQPFLSNAWDKTKDFGGNALDKTKDFGGNAWDKTKDFSGNAWDKTKEFGGNALDKSQPFLSNAWDKTKDFGGNALDKSQQFGSNAWDKVQQHAPNAWDKTKAFGGNAWDKMQKHGGNAWDQTKQFGGNAWDQMQQHGGNALDKIQEHAPNAWDKTKQFGGNAWDKIQQHGGNAWDQIQEHAPNAWDKTKQFGGNAWNTMQQHGGNAWDTIQQHAPNAWDTMKHEGGNQGPNIPPNIPPDIHGPQWNKPQWNINAPWNAIHAQMRPQTKPQMRPPQIEQQLRQTNVDHQTPQMMPQTRPDIHGSQWNKPWNVDHQRPQMKPQTNVDQQRPQMMPQTKPDLHNMRPHPPHTNMDQQTPEQYMHNMHTMEDKSMNALKLEDILNEMQNGFKKNDERTMLLHKLSNMKRKQNSLDLEHKMFIERRKQKRQLKKFMKELMNGLHGFLAQYNQIHDAPTNHIQAREGSESEQVPLIPPMPPLHVHRRRILTDEVYLQSIVKCVVEDDVKLCVEYDMNHGMFVLDLITEKEKENKQMKVRRNSDALVAYRYEVKWNHKHRACIDLQVIPYDICFESKMYGNFAIYVHDSAKKDNKKSAHFEIEWRNNEKWDKIVDILNSKYIQKCVNISIANFCLIHDGDSLLIIELKVKI